MPWKNLHSEQFYLLTQQFVTLALPVTQHNSEDLPQIQQLLRYVCSVRWPPSYDRKLLTRASKPTSTYNHC